MATVFGSLMAADCFQLGPGSSLSCTLTCKGEATASLGIPAIPRDSDSLGGLSGQEENVPRLQLHKKWSLPLQIAIYKAKQSKKKET